MYTQGGTHAPFVHSAICVSIRDPVRALSGGVSVSSLHPEEQAALVTRLQQRFMQIDLTTPGLLVQCLDPPIFTVESLLHPQACADIVDAAQSTGEAGVE